MRCERGVYIGEGGVGMGMGIYYSIGRRLDFETWGFRWWNIHTCSE